MKNAVDDTDAAFAKKTGIKVVASYAATSALIKQIEQGAPADVFASADPLSIMTLIRIEFLVLMTFQ